MLRTSTTNDDLKGKKEIIEGELAKDPLTAKSDFSLRLKYSK